VPTTVGTVTATYMCSAAWIRSILLSLPIEVFLLSIPS
jgi:hypothetical protein